MSLSAYFAWILVSAILIVAAWSLWAAAKHRKVYEKISKTSTFYCLKCDSVYVSREGEKAKACPKCGYKNAEMKF